MRWFCTLILTLSLMLWVTPKVHAEQACSEQEQALLTALTPAVLW